LGTGSSPTARPRNRVELPGSRENLLFLSNGDGTFAERGRQSGLGLVDASGMAAFCDWNRDGWLDCHIALSWARPLIVPRQCR
jgi:hypothetical protein